MEVLKFTQRPLAGTVIRARPPRVYVNGGRRRDLKVSAWHVLPAPEFGLVELMWHRAGAGIASLASGCMFAARGGPAAASSSAWSASTASSSARTANN